MCVAAGLLYMWNWTSLCFALEMFLIMQSTSHLSLLMETQYQEGKATNSNKNL